MKKYYIISMDEDGEWQFHEYDTLEEVADDYGIDESVEDYVEGGHPAEEFKKTIDEYNPGHVLIYGEILLPKKKEVVTRWDFEVEE